LRSPRGGVEIVGAASFTFFVKGAGFSRSFQRKSDTEHNLTTIGGVTSTSEIFAYHPYVPQYGPATASAD
jgi:hypothetical protein